MESTSGLLISLIILVILPALILFEIISMWMIFTKAEKPGWGVLIPIYNIYLILKIAGRPGEWVPLAFLPPLNLVFLLIPFDIAKKFEKNVYFGFGLLFLGFIFFPILAFSNAEYIQNDS